MGETRSRERVRSLYEYCASTVQIMHLGSSDKRREAHHTVRRGGGRERSAPNQSSN